MKPYQDLTYRGRLRRMRQVARHALQEYGLQIDFDDSGFGYWVFDLAVALDACRDYPDYPRYREALLNGYAEFRALPEQQAEQIELFLAGLQVYWNLWATGGTHLYPDLLPIYRERIARTADFVVRYMRLKGCLL